MSEMTYYDIHTHHPPQHPEDVAIIDGPDGLYRSVGIHPRWISEDMEKQLTELKQAATLPGVVAIGEAGLDKLVDIPLKRQQEIFQILAAFAESVSRPLLIHCVKAWDEMIAAKRDIAPHVPWIIHGFRGNEHLAKQLLGQGFLLSFGQYFNPEALRQAWPGCALAETDDGQTDIRFVYRQIAETLRLPLEQVVAQLAVNVGATFPGL